MATTYEAVEDLRCSFCGKPNSEVEKVVAGPGVQICNQCVDLLPTLACTAAPSLATSKAEKGAEKGVRNLFGV